MDQLLAPYISQRKQYKLLSLVSIPFHTVAAIISRILNDLRETNFHGTQYPEYN
ncbi:hypothetical protein C8J57DRAFT_1511397 [Mycena rebaudengoi]|nr:hypothetical protein C8J57DRAFT_1511397 [Mycena rebaudengoi]